MLGCAGLTRSANVGRPPSDEALGQRHRDDGHAAVIVLQPRRRSGGGGNLGGERPLTGRCCVNVGRRSARALPTK